MALSVAKVVVFEVIPIQSENQQRATRLATVVTCPATEVKSSSHCAFSDVTALPATTTVLLALAQPPKPEKERTGGARRKRTSARIGGPNNRSKARTCPRTI